MGSGSIIDRRFQPGWGWRVNQWHVKWGNLFKIIVKYKGLVMYYLFIYLIWTSYLLKIREYNFTYSQILLRKSRLLNFIIIIN